MADADGSLFNQLPASDAPEDLASAETGGMQLPDVWKQISDSSSR
jgi:hypothetical protein